MVLKQIYIFLVSFATGALITIPIFRALALRLNIVDRPDGNLKKHHKVTPYLGGVAIFTALWLVLIFNINFSGILPGLFFGTLIILIVGLIDDIFLLTPFQKLLGQMFSAVILVYYNFNSLLGLPFFGDYFLSVFWLISLMNAFNLIDVMDGLAVTACASATCGFIGYVAYLKQHDLLLLLIVFLGAQLAFLYHNRPCATIYLGDAGSMLLGAIIGAVSLKVNWIYLGNSIALNYLTAPMIVGIPIIEVCSLVIIRRIKNVPFYNGSHDHYVHYLRRKNWSDYNILFFTVAYTFLLIFISVLNAFNICTLSKYLLICITTLLLWISIIFI